MPPREERTPELLDERDKLRLRPISTADELAGASGAGASAGAAGGEPERGGGGSCGSAILRSVRGSDRAVEPYKLPSEVLVESRARSGRAGRRKEVEIREKMSSGDNSLLSCGIAEERFLRLHEQPRTALRTRLPAAMVSYCMSVLLLAALALSGAPADECCRLCRPPCARVHRRPADDELEIEDFAWDDNKKVSYRYSVTPLAVSLAPMLTLWAPLRRCFTTRVRAATASRSPAYADHARRQGSAVLL